MRTCCTFLLLGAVLTLALGPLPAADWPQWRGPDGTAISKETGLLKTWPKEGPKLLWKSEKAGQGYGGMAIVGGTVYTMGAQGDDEYILALDDKGNQKWSTKVGPVLDWKGNSWSRGTNGTPLVDGDLVYGLTSRGMLICVNKNDGKPAWKLDLIKDLEGQVNPIGGGYEEGKEILGWGYASSPLADGNQLVIVPGGPKGLFTALDKKTGKLIWRSKEVTDQASYATPTIATVGGVKQYIVPTQDKVHGVAANDGRLLWTHALENPSTSDIVGPTPLPVGDGVIVSIGYQVGCDRLKLVPNGKKFKAEVVWHKRSIANRLGGVVQLGDYLYGYHEDRNWACQNAATGDLAWPKGGARVTHPAGPGAILAADGRIYAVIDPRDKKAPGGVALLAASPKEFQLLSQFTLPEASKRRKSQGGVWAHPSLSDGKLYVRDQELVFCYQVK